MTKSARVRAGLMTTMLATLSLVISSSAFATQFEQDSRYIYQTVPYTQAMSSQDETQAIMGASLDVFVHYVRKLIAQGAIPKELATLDDLKKLDEANADIQTGINYLNEWIERAKDQSPGFMAEALDTLPDAFIVFIGGKSSINLGVGAGGSLMGGLVVMPVKVTRIDKLSGQVVDSYYSARVSLVGWVSPNVGMGAGGGARARMGMGFIWGSDSFTDPAQFMGGGLGYSQSFVATVGINAKVGFLNNPNLPDFFDMFYATAAWEMGPAATVEGHVNGTAILPLARIIELFDDKTADLISAEEMEIQRELDNILSRDLGPVSEDDVDMMTR